MIEQNGNILPEGIRGWSWGAFLLNWIWAIFNKTWLGLLCFVPVVGIAMPFVLGFKGREWAWKNDTWDSVEHFNRVQKNWSKWGVILAISGMLIGGITGVSLYFVDVAQKTESISTSATLPTTEVQIDTLSLPEDKIATPAQTTTPATLANHNVSGKWSSDIAGDVTIEQFDNKITGSYQYDDDDDVTQIGKFDAVLEGNTLKGDWHEHPKSGKGEKSHGDLELVLSSDAASIKGWYREEGEKDKESWILVRK